MIVKNEAAVIARCLESVEPIISHWVICDTGSTDSTKKMIRKLLKGIPGKLYDDAWVNFGHNRSLGLQRAKGKADYHLLLDADMVLNVRPGFDPSALTEDAYNLRFEGDCDYQVIRLISDRHDWRYIGVTHEHVHSATATAPVTLPFLTVTHHEDGGARSDKYERDIRLLTEALGADPANSRNTYYLAQSYRDSGDHAHALDCYEKRALMGGWEEEVWSALYQMARMQHALGNDWRVVMQSYLQAYNYRPHRLEPLLPIARFYREHQQYRLGYLFSRPITETPYPADTLFIEKRVYEHELLMEYGICCYWLGLHEESIRVADLILLGASAPENYRTSAEQNRALSYAALMKERALAAAGETA